MTNFAYWQSQSPPGTFLCMLCFEQKPLSEASPVEGGFEDVCLTCKADEDERMRERML